MEEEKKAYALKQEADGTYSVMARAEGSEARELIAEAQRQGIEVVEDGNRVEEIAADTEAFQNRTLERISFLVSEIEAFVAEMDAAFVQEAAGAADREELPQQEEEYSEEAGEVSDLEIVQEEN